MNQRFQNEEIRRVAEQFADNELYKAICTIGPQLENESREFGLCSEECFVEALELLSAIADKGEDISFYKQGDFTDLCAGPHLMSVAPVKAFKLTNCTGAYWRGDSKNKMLCRVYGVSFPKASQLEEHLTMLEEAKKTITSSAESWNSLPRWM